MKALLHSHEMANHVERKHPYAYKSGSMKSPTTDLTTSMLIHEVIAVQAGRKPDKPAVQCGDVAITYFELTSRANQLARYLREKGVGAESLAMLCVHRSMDMVVGILGILMAGGAYIPVDPSYPRERIRSILEDSKADIVLTHTTLVDALPETGSRIVCMDEERRHIESFSGEALETITSPEDLAYIIYTSGSTGAPKGVMISHDSLRNFVRISQSALDVSQDDVYLQSASIAYAVSVRQLMVPLSNGASVVIANEEQARDPLLLFEEIKRSHVTLMDVVPSSWRSIIRRLQDLSPAARRDLLANDLRRIVSVGEALPYDVPLDWLAFGHPARLVNIFGQTETTGVVAAYPIPSRMEAQTSGIVPVGRPLADTRLYILDENLVPVQNGESGELCISNPCLARGYLNQPGLTAGKFIQNPFLDGFNGHLYRTGDMARRLDDGNIEFIGRADTQIKIRGQRVELGEVESVIRTCPGVDDCVVLAVGERPDEKSLTAYVVSVDRSANQADIRKFCRKTLADYMIPSAFVFLDAFPLNPNGKVDRRALAAIAPIEEEVQTTTSDTPRDAIEEKLVLIWRDLLRLKHIGIHDDFFDLGGQSLLAVRLFARIEREFGVRLPLTTLFHATTITMLANLLRDQRDLADMQSVVVPIRYGNEKPILFGVHGHEGGVLFWRDVVMHLPPDQPFYAIQAQGVDGLQKAHTRIEDMAALYIREVQKIQPHGPYFICGFSMGGEIAFEMSQQLLKIGEQVELLVMLDTKNPERFVRIATQTKVAAGSAAESNRIDRIWDNEIWKRIQWHIHQFLGHGERSGIVHIWLLIKTWVVRAVIFRLVSFLHDRNFRIPDSLLMLYLRTAHSKALYAYIPTHYPGKVTLFRSLETRQKYPDDSPWGWQSLAGGGLEIHYFDATHNIVDEEYAEEVAHKLQECLVQVRGN